MPRQRGDLAGEIKGDSLRIERQCNGAAGKFSRGFPVGERAGKRRAAARAGGKSEHGGGKFEESLIAGGAGLSGDAAGKGKGATWRCFGRCDGKFGQVFGKRGDSGLGKAQRPAGSAFGEADDGGAVVVVEIGRLGSEDIRDLHVAQPLQPERAAA